MQEESTKKTHIENIMIDIEKHRIHNQKNFKKLKVMSTVMQITSTTLNALSVSSIILAIGPQMPAFIIVGLCSSSASTLISTIERVSNINFKMMRYNTSAHQYADLHRDIQATLKRNHLSSADLDVLLSDINHRLSLIEDSLE